MSIPFTPNRRSFMSVLTSLAGLTALHVTGTEAAAQAPAGAQRRRWTSAGSTT